jgi:hypothetical protein
MAGKGEGQESSGKKGEEGKKGIQQPGAGVGWERRTAHKR